MNKCNHYQWILFTVFSNSKSHWKAPRTQEARPQSVYFVCLFWRLLFISQNSITLSIRPGFTVRVWGYLLVTPPGNEKTVSRHNVKYSKVFACLEVPSYGSSHHTQTSLQKAPICSLQAADSWKGRTILLHTIQYNTVKFTSWELIDLYIHLNHRYGQSGEERISHHLYTVIQVIILQYDVWTACVVQYNTCVPTELETEMQATVPKKTDVPPNPAVHKEEENG